MCNEMSWETEGELSACVPGDRGYPSCAVKPGNLKSLTHLSPGHVLVSKIPWRGNTFSKWGN